MNCSARAHLMVLTIDFDFAFDDAFGGFSSMQDVALVWLVFHSIRLFEVVEEVFD